ncbi:MULTISPECIES: serine protease [Sphingobacterium]|uniref:S1 family peptidase n=1 Tax=Sphingobacterium TaxID=28453 RepID=UPI0013DBC407|nr:MULTISPECIES: serine protease [unclassified Sphingobacterium]
MSNSKLILDVFNVFALDISDDVKYKEVYNRGTERNMMSHNVGVTPESVDERFKLFGLNCDEIAIYLANQSNTGVSVQNISSAIDLLERKALIKREDFMRSAFVSHVYKPTYVRYKISKVGCYLWKFGLSANFILGFSSICQTYKSSVLIMEGHLETGDTSLGTGFLLDLNHKRYLATCKHNVEQLIDFRITDGEANLEYSKDFHCHPDEDIALIEIYGADDRKAFIPSFLKGSEPFLFEQDPLVLSEVITMGYPSIPTSEGAYLMSHKGEVNGMVRSYFGGGEKILFSAKTSSGNSGSPLINCYGEVIGIVEKELYDKNSFIDKGKLPYYSAVPIERIKEIQLTAKTTI